jgi:NitT/TauT family transport system substrate-binding protein
LTGVSAAFGTAPESKSATLALDWFPEAEFAGYYVAREEGVYRQYGLEIAMLHGGPDQEPLTLLEEGKAQFVTMPLMSAIIARSHGAKIVDLAQIERESSLLLVARKSSGITSLSDLNGKKLGIWPLGFDIQENMLLKKYNLQVKPVPLYSGTMNLFLRGAIDVTPASRYDEYHEILSAGLNEDELTVFPLSEYGLGFPEDAIFCTEETLRADPKMCRDFVRATIEGWRRAFDHPDKTIPIVMAYVNEAEMATNRAHQDWMLKAMRDKILASSGDASEIGLLTRDRYMEVAKALEDAGIIDNIPDFSTFYVNCAGVEKDPRQGRGAGDAPRR